MPSLIFGYDYDIFISYRQNDNLSGWVTEFVKALQQELAATLKEPPAIYFDQNPHDGLLETHHVDKSLEGKLKCLIFIPIISQTYCDTKSFAWQCEFCAFNQFAQQDALGRDIRLHNGNVASRILPIIIHELDAHDRQAIETEISGALRGIEFIYKEPGVNRPLKPADKRELNLNKTDYQNQVNKVANAVKELMSGMLRHDDTAPKKSVPATRKRSSPNLLWIGTGTLTLLALLAGYYLLNIESGTTSSYDKSIAVLPFTNLSGDSTQNYFSDGIADDILNHLSKIADLRVKSRTSTQQYRNTRKSMPQIAEELGANTILEGSVRRAGNQLRVVVQLIDARNDTHIWSETYDRPLDDVLKIQSEIAMEVAAKLAATVTPLETDRIQKPASSNLTAYDYFLRGRELIKNGEIFDDGIEAQQMFKKAVQLDPNFAEAYAEWSMALSFDDSRSLKQKTIDSAFLLANKAIVLDGTLGAGYYARYWCNFVTNRFLEMLDDLKKAHQFSPNDPEILNSLGINLYRSEKYMDGARLRLKALQLQGTKNSRYYLINLAHKYEVAGEVESAKEILTEAQQLYSNDKTVKVSLAASALSRKNYEEGIRLIKEAYPSSETLNWREKEFVCQIQGDSYFVTGEFDKAQPFLDMFVTLERERPDTTIKTDFRHKLGFILYKKGDVDRGLKLIHDDIQIHKKALKPNQVRPYYVAVYQFNLAAMYSFLNERDKALHYLDSALQQEDYGIETHPMFDNLRQDTRFQQLYKRKQRHWQLNQAAMKQALREFEAGPIQLR